MKLKLNREEISSKIKEGGNDQGGYFLAVTPQQTSIHWADTARPWDPWPWSEGAYVIGIPALYPTGSGLEAEDAQDCLRDILSPAEAKAVEAKLDEDGLDIVEYVEEKYPDWMEACRDNQLEHKLDEFLVACNGQADNDPAPWGMTDGDFSEAIEPPFEFEFLGKSTY